MMLPENAFTVTCLTWSVFDLIPGAYIYPGDYLVLVEYKYKHQKDYDYDVCTMSIFDPMKQSDVNDGKGTYLDTDLWEGQEEFYIVAYVDLSLDIVDMHKMKKDLTEYLNEFSKKRGI